MFSPTLILYRGDSTNIDEFKVSKTNKDCLYGKGIYLTTAEPVAHSYRDKDVPSYVYQRLASLPFSQREYVLLNQQCETKGAALEMAKLEYCAFREACAQKLPTDSAIRAKIRAIQKDPRLIAKAMDKYAHDWLDVLDSNRLVFTKTSPTWIGGKSSQGTRVTPIWKVVLPATHSASRPGRVTKFEFDRLYLERNTVCVDKPYPDSLVWHALIEIGFRVPQDWDVQHTLSMQWMSKLNIPSDLGEIERQKILLTRFATGLPLIQVIPRLREKRVPFGKSRAWTISVWENLRKKLEPYGCIGFRHTGGSIVGGYGRHTVYILWDEDLVNAHRVAIIK
jgi:hypothetical protein